MSDWGEDGIKFHRTGTKKRMVCVECFMSIESTVVQAQSHGWKTWVGGAMCKRCVEQAQPTSVGRGDHGY